MIHNTINSRPSISSFEDNCGDCIWSAHYCLTLVDRCSDRDCMFKSDTILNYLKSLFPPPCSFYNCPCIGHIA